MSAREGVSFPSDSSTSAARTVMADALRKADPVGSRAIENETNWRRNYLAHFRRAVEAGVGEATAAHRIAADGLRSAHDLMRFGDLPLDEAITGSALTQAFGTRTVEGAGDPETELSIPYRGERLSGRALVEQLDRWVAAGVITASASQAVQTVQDNPDWLRLDGDTVVVLGAGAEMGPYRALLRWGAQVVALDLPRDDVQQRIRALADESAGRALLPARIVTRGDDTGADLLTELPGVAQWLEGLPGRLVIGNYCYADGGTHVRLSMAADALAEHLVDRRDDTALAFLATPTDTFAVPAEEVRIANDAYASRSRLIRTPLRLASGGRLLQRHYPPGADPGICDALVPQQGPNYALAKRLQRWRATTSRQAGTTVSLNVAPATRTRSVVKNKALAAAYAGSHRFGVEIFDPATSNTLMAALLVHDLRAGASPQAEPWQDEAVNAAHGGLWTAAYDPRSALGLAAVLGIGALRS
ncbi:hypothetical protein [Aeromicrobium fastidiosum]|uniref:Uncharacterized protein n=1 Tax=Aeromicrobium fastidiosum TaxID=52699 RepID=A0A641AT72_9ACTN|nr:hypothetical protein [Aeromicrobium fastidiosum]KAA1380251.1 hypothetical protein ESP62_003380 [Aeromicrobium fastidiosum]MBP2389802.1 hypothetical protein [Aeromicrobium fastidiosum]